MVIQCRVVPVWQFVVWRANSVLTLSTMFDFFTDIHQAFTYHITGTMPEWAAFKYGCFGFCGTRVPPGLLVHFYHWVTTVHRESVKTYFPLVIMVWQSTGIRQLRKYSGRRRGLHVGKCLRNCINILLDFCIIEFFLVIGHVNTRVILRSVSIHSWLKEMLKRLQLPQTLLLLPLLLIWLVKG